MKEWALMLSHRFWLVLLLVAHVVLLAISASLHSPTFNEVGHVPAGICHWRYKMFHLYRVNPPFPRMVATIPLLFSDVRTDWSNYQLSSSSREQIPMGIRFCRVNGSATFKAFTLARWACIPFSVLGAWICYRWSLELWGRGSGMIALTMWCTCPMILGHGQFVMPDVPAAAMGLCATYLFWRWLKKPHWARCAATGIVLGLALLSKTTLLVFFLVWPMLIAVRVCVSGKFVNDLPRNTLIGMTMLMLCLSIYVVNLGYGMTGTFERLGDFRFRSQLLSGRSGKILGNRFSATALQTIPVPLTKDYLLGIDRQRTDFEEGDRSYLRGNWQEGGWWYYHVYGLSIKLPLGMLLLLAVAIGLTCAHSDYKPSWDDEGCLLMPAAAIVLLVSSQTGFSNHVRYCIPALPFLIVWMSKVGQAFCRRHLAIAAFAVVCTTHAVTSSLWIYPHGLSYFNELVGGPRNGHNHLLDSNIAWGQDLLFLRRWLDRHPEIESIGLASFGWVHPNLAQIDFEMPPVGLKPESHQEVAEAERKTGPLPGWYAIDVNHLHGTSWPIANTENGWTELPPDGANLRYFEHFEPITTIGYSTNVYHVSKEAANELRHSMGLAPATEP